MASPIYSFVCNSIDGKPISLSEYKGKVMLIVNTASICGLTTQFTGLEQIYRDYKDKGLVVLGFPSSQFNEEPYDNDRISNFCITNYDVTFPMFAKIMVNGKDADPLYTFLKKEQPGLFGVERLHYNFTKFLVDREGNVIRRFSPLTFPNSINAFIKELI